MSNKSGKKMFFKKVSSNKEYNKGVSLLASRVLWVKKNKRPSVILIGGTGETTSPSFFIDLHKQLIETSDMSIVIYSLSQEKLIDIDWAHDLIIFQCNDIFSTNQLFELSDKIDCSFMMIKAASSSRHAISKASDFLEELNIEISGVILSDFMEKIPNFIKRIFL
jgi:Na+-transporting NADH:ubiquinone oxidoreductase subunit NqrF